jgi:hypothetical protein
MAHAETDRAHVVRPLQKKIEERYIELVSLLDCYHPYPVQRYITPLTKPSKAMWHTLKDRHWNMSVTQMM